MEAIRDIQKRYCSRAMTAAIVVGFLLILAGQNAVGKGLVLGAIFSVVNFVIMGELLPLKMGKSPSKTFFWSLASMLLRYALVAIPIVVAIKLDIFNLFAVIIGIFSVQGTILAESLLRSVSLFRRKQT